MDREQDVAMQDEGDADVSRRLAVVDQEVGADVHLAVVFLVEAGRFLEVVVDGVARDGQAEVLGDPALFLVGRRVEIDPHRPDVGQRPVALDLFLEEPAVGQREDVQHEGSGELTARWSGRLPWCDEAPMLPSVAAPRGDAQRPWGGPASAGNVQDGVSKCGDEIIASRWRSPRTARCAFHHGDRLNRTPLRTTLFTRQAKAALLPCPAALPKGFT